MVLTGFGASYGMSKSGIGVMVVGILRPDKMMQSESNPILRPIFFPNGSHVRVNVVIDMMPPILASIVSIYGLIVAVMISNSLIEKLPLFTSFLQLGAGIAVGLSGLAAGYVG